jgi:hypothetical protein
MERNGPASRARRRPGVLEARRDLLLDFVVWMPRNEFVKCLWSLEETFLLQLFCGALDDANGFSDEQGYSRHDPVFDNPNAMAILAVRFFHPFMPINTLMDRWNLSRQVLQGRSRGVR